MFGKDTVDFLGQQHPDQVSGTRTFLNANASALMEAAEVVPNTRADSKRRCEGINCKKALLLSHESRGAKQVILNPPLA
jgi:hypothetical protein